jgi:hypothetical protein
MRRREALLALPLLALVGCTTTSPALHAEPAGRHIVYELDVERAKRIVHALMSAQFAGRPIDALPAPSIGFTTYTRNMLDTWSTNVTIVPVTATAGGKDFAAVRIETAGGGSQVWTGKPQYDAFLARLKQELDSTGAVREVERYSIR